MSKNCKSQPRCIYCGNGKHREEEECSLKSSPPTCINCKGAHLPTSHECIVVTRYKMALSMASTENIPLAEAKRRVGASLSGSSSLSKDIRFDYQNFPNLPQRQQSSPSSQSVSHPFFDPNRFSVLSDLSTNLEGLPRRTFSAVTAHPTKTSMHPTRRTSSSCPIPRCVSRSEDPRREYLVYPNGRSSFGRKNGVAIPAPAIPSVVSPLQSLQGSPPTSLFQGSEDLMIMVKKCLDDLIQPFYCAIIERLSHLNSDFGTPSSPLGSSHQPLSASTTAFVDPLGYPPLPSHP